MNFDTQLLFTSKVKVQKSFPLTSVEGIEAVPDNPKAFYVYFKSFVMELEASNQGEASKWVEIMTQGERKERKREVRCLVGVCKL